MKVTITRSGKLDCLSRIRPDDTSITMRVSTIPQTRHAQSFVCRDVLAIHGDERLMERITGELIRKLVASYRAELEQAVAAALKAAPETTWSN